MRPKVQLRWKIVFCATAAVDELDSSSSSILTAELGLLIQFQNGENVCANVTEKREKESVLGLVDSGFPSFCLCWLLDIFFLFVCNKVYFRERVGGGVVRRRMARKIISCETNHAYE